MAQDGFPPTHWSAVVAARSDDPAERERALDLLTQAYWRPVYSYIRLRHRRVPEDAQDLTQEFFARLLEKDILGDFDPVRARLRTYLRVAIDRLVANIDRAARREKRGGGAATLALDFVAAESELGHLRAPTAETAEDFFAREWARAFFGMAVDALRAECIRRGKGLHFQAFTRYDLDEHPGGEGGRPTYAELALELGISVTDLTNHLAWARREFRRLAIEKLRELTVSEDEFRSEARALLGIEAR